MKTTIDPAGRIVIPKPIREQLGLSGAQEVEVLARDGRIEIEVAATPMHLEGRGAGFVAVPERELPALTAEAVRETLERVRR
jgi:AbrB family looped-hinge helix DNA binding protein